MRISESMPAQMKAIMEKKGMEASDFIRTEGDFSEENMKKLTSSRFYDVYNGTNTNPKIEFIDTFCEIAGVGSEHFLDREVDEYVASLTDDDRELMIRIQKLHKSKYKELQKYVEMLLEMQNEEQ